MIHKPTVLFVCVHNASRSQMAAGWLKHLAGDRVEIWSAGSEPADQINPMAVQVMREVGVDISGEIPMILTTDSVSRADGVITMGCGDACPYFPGKRYEDWALTDPPVRGSRSCARSATASGTASPRCWPSGCPHRTARCPCWTVRVVETGGTRVVWGTPN